jgi:coatomer subunit beta'
MPLRLDIKKKLSARSDRVKCVDFHPDEPWILTALFSGHLFIWNYVTQTMVKSVEVCELPLRTAKFIPQKQWIVCGADVREHIQTIYHTISSHAAIIIVLCTRNKHRCT